MIYSNPLKITRFVGFEVTKIKVIWVKNYTPAKLSKATKRIIFLNHFIECNTSVKNYEVLKFSIMLTCNFILMMTTFIGFTLFCILRERYINQIAC